jgi:hypothetical protein
MLFAHMLSASGILYHPEDKLFSWRFRRFVHQALDEQEPRLKEEEQNLATLQGQKRAGEKFRLRLAKEAFHAIRKLMEGKPIAE